MAKPVVVDFLGNNAGLKASVASTSASLAALDKQIKDGSVSWDKLSASNERWGRSIVAAAKVGAVGMAGVTAALGGAVVAAANFDSAMRNVNSIAGLSQAGFKGLEAQVLRLSTAVGKSPTDLANGLYSIVSSGFKAQDAMKILTAGAKAARAGLTDTATATGAITQALNAYGLGAKDAKAVSDKLFEGVNFGVQNFEQLSASIGRVLPQGKALGVSLTELLAAQAALTRGNSNADESSTELGQIFTSLVKPSKTLSAELKNMGYASGQAAIEHLGLKGTLDQLGKAANGNQALLASWFKNIRAFRGVAGLEGSAHDVAQYTAAIKAMNDATKGAGETQAVYNEQQKSTSAQFDHLKASIDVAAVTIGTALLPEIDKGIDALNKWFLQAQKSGELQSFATTIATDVKATVAWLVSLGPAAQKAIGVISTTIAAAIPYAKGLESIMQDLAPEFEAVGHAAVGLTSAIGPGPILGAVGAYLVLNRALLTTQAGMGKFAAVMKAGSEATALAGGGAVSASGRIDTIGKAAVANASTASIAARGIAATFGPTLLLAGAAGIVGSLLYIRSTMTSLKDEARDVVEAIAQIGDAKTAHTAAVLAVAQQQVVVSKTAAQLGPAAVAVAQARASAPRGGHPDIADPGLTKAISDQTTKILNHASAVNQLRQDQQDAAVAAGKEGDAQQKLADQLVGFGQKARGKTGAQGAGASFLGSPASTSAASAATIRDQKKAVDDFVTSLKSQTLASDTLDASGKRLGLGIANVVKQLGFIPTDKQLRIIANDKDAGDSIAKIKADLAKVAGPATKAKVTADTEQAQVALQILQAKKDNLAKVTEAKVKADTSSADATLDAFSRRIAALHGKTVTISEIIASGGSKASRQLSGATGMYIGGGSWDGIDNIPVMVTRQEAIVNPTQMAMIDSGRYTVLGALAATGAPMIGGGHAGGGKPLFTHEGPDEYAAAYKHNRQFAKPPIDRGFGPYQTPLTDVQESRFRSWNRINHTYFDPNARITDYDMRGYWLSVGGPSGVTHKDGLHFTDRFKTPYDTTFSRESKYSTSNNPDDWVGNSLIDLRTGQLIFGPPTTGHAGGGKPAKPKPVQYESFPLQHYLDQKANAAKLMSTDKSTLTGYAHSEAKINKAITDAQKKVATAKTAATRKKYQEAADALVKRSQAPLAGLIARISNTQSLIQNRDEPELTEATRIAKAATVYQRKITNDQNDAQYASNAMSLASDQWSAANTRGDAKGMAKAIVAYNAAAKKRTGADSALKTLLAQAQGVLKDNSPYWKTITDQITSADIDQTQASDSTAVPGYSAPGAFDASSLVFLSAEHQYQLDRALQLDANGNPVDPGTAKYLLGLELTNAQRGEAIAAASGNFAIADQIVQTENGIQSQLAQLNAPTVTAQTADQAAQLAQSQGQVQALTRNQGFDAAFGNAISQPGGPQLAFGIMFGDSRTVAGVGQMATKAFNNQPYIVQNAGAINV